MGTKIKFIDTLKSVNEKYYPYPAKEAIPDWYKNLENYNGGKPEVYQSMAGSVTNQTVKRCMPFFDSMTAGYIIPTPTDVFVSQKEGVPFYQWPDFTMISTHAHFQIKGHPDNKYKENVAIPKWNNPWSIITPKGYSCLFVQPLHRESPFKIIEGIVDTDKYTNPVLFPFVFKNPDWEGIIPAGTPMAQVIPFKREKYRIEISKKEKDLDNAEKVLNTIKTGFFGVYRKNFWERKDYN